MQIEKAISYFLVALETEQLSEHSIRAYQQDLYQFYSSIQKDDLDSLTFEDFQEYFISIKSLRASSLNRKRIVLKRFLKFCFQKKLCQNHLEEWVDPIRFKRNSAPKEVLSHDEIQQIMDFLDEEISKCRLKASNAYYDYLFYCAVRNRLIIYILFYTGCRAHEVVALKKADVDLKGKLITLFTKGQKYNQVPMHEKLIEAFELYENQLQEVSADIRYVTEESVYLFPSKMSPQTYMPTRTLHDYMKRLSHVVGRHIHAHLFRHTFASYCIAAKMDIATISSLISHSNPSITLSVYTHEISAYNKRQQIDKLDFNQ